ncbi:MAG TPA: glycoside hydrolase family 15 protein [Acidisarcina sp.]|nr:glycoside hydrolase family 15 protein [Acidisarcina sp.]
MGFQPIEDYGVIGNMRSLALIGTNGSIDFLCYPNCDSPTIFAAILDPEKGGCFSICPLLKGHRTRQLYLPDTNILLTRFLASDGVAELTDFMSILSEDTSPNEVVRMIRVVKGSITFSLRCDPKFDYARGTHSIVVAGCRAVFTPSSGACPPMSLSATVPLEEKQGEAVASFTLKAGETATFVLGALRDEPDHVDLPSVTARFNATSHYWRTWIGNSNYTGRWREMVNRSALMLKLLVDRKYGSLIAAPTFGLPEEIGGERNWDYRYTWLRDSSFSLYALIRLGFVEESEAFIRWLKDRLGDDAERGPLQVMYAIDGTKKLEEITLDHLRGYRDSRPVRIGNAAYQQLQLDIYGEMLDSIYLANKYGDAISHEDWDDVKRILAWLEKNWERPDNGIWEVRGGPREFLHSRLMCWVAFDRAIRLGQKRSLTAPFPGWIAARDAIHDEIYKSFWNEKLGAFVQSKGSDQLDAAVLLMPMMRFISPVDPMWLSTLDAIERNLVEDTLVYRYNDASSHVDGLRGREGSFTACSFWYIECLARSHKLDKARLLFEKMLGYANHVGLYAEQLGSSGEHLGNYPQALTHLALISAATYLDRRLSGKENTQWR